MTGSPEGFSLVSVGRGLLGVLSIIVIGFLLSNNRKRIDWKLIGTGLVMQLVFALLVLYVPFVGTILELLGKVFVKLLDFTQEGMTFLLGSYASKQNGFIFMLHAIPNVILFSALVSLCYHWGIIQKIVGGFAWLLRKILRSISGAEGLVVSGNAFLGMSEAPVLIKNYLGKMTSSELFLVMVSGMGTISGTVMGAYIGMLGGNDPQAQLLFAKHLLSASFMAIPGSIVIAKLIFPQTKQTRDEAVFEQRNKRSNALEALASGTMTGVKLLINICAMLLVFIALVALCNYILKDLIGHYTGLNAWIQDITGGRADGLTFQFIVGLIFSPLMWLTGVPMGDILPVGSLLGQKTILNEFVAYNQLAVMQAADVFVSNKSVIMSTYMLCGFANIGSIGILLGGLGVLVPEKRPLIARLGFPSLVAGALVSILSATIVSMFLV